MFLPYLTSLKSPNKMMLKPLFTSLLLSGTLGIVHAQLIVENDLNPIDLVSMLDLPSDVVVFNVSFSGDTNQVGLFNAEMSNIPIHHGVVLGTGNVQGTIGPNDSPSATTGGGNLDAADADLALLSGMVTNDAAVLEFDFFAQESASFDLAFVFGSEEYNEYVCSTVNDAVGVFLSGPGIDGPFENGAVNLATVPGTETPVSINTINLGIPGTSGNAMNCDALDSLWQMNAAYFYNNDVVPCPGETQLDGFTVPLTISVNVDPGFIYHLKIAIADGGDTAYDSALFLEGGNWEGCTNNQAINYDPFATTEDGSCTFAEVLCEEMGAVNFGNPGACCFSDSEVDIPEIQGAWRIGLDYGSIQVGPNPQNGDWFTTAAVGPQLDDVWTFFPNGALVYNTNGEVMDPANGYNGTPLTFPLLGYSIDEGAGAFGLGKLTLSNPQGTICPFMGTWDSGPSYDILTLSADTLRLVSPIMDIPTCAPAADGGYFTVTFIRTTPSPTDEDLCIWGCTDPSAPNFEPQAVFDNGNCQQLGCTYPEASNFDEGATDDDGSCTFMGCTDAAACNFNPLANQDDGSCIDCNEDAACLADLDSNGLVAVSDLLILLGAFGEECALPEANWTCGDPLTYQGHDYATAMIAGTCWFQENLRSTAYGNGNPVPTALDDAAWSATTEGATAVYGEGLSTCFDQSLFENACDEAVSLDLFGRLYNGYAVLDPRGLCPSGWSVPSGTTWNELFDAFGGSDLAGLALKAEGGWAPQWAGNNNSGFSGLPNGYRMIDGSFVDVGGNGVWWSTQWTNSGAYSALLWAGNDITWSDSMMAFGFSVRCVQEAE